MKRTALFAALALGATATVLPACQSSKPPAPLRSSGKSASLQIMEQVSRAAYRCWFSSKDPEFRGYAFANELNSHSGQPRFLLVPARNFGGRPLLVVQAKGNSSRLDVFGPLLGEPLGRRVSSDLSRWSAGSTDCGASA